MRAAMVCMLLLGGFTAHAQQPQVREIVAPTYPRLAWLANLQGTVIAELEISRDGNIESVKASGADALLVNETEKNVRQWSFGPFAETTAYPVKLKMRYRYRFEGEPEDELLPAKVVITIPDRVEIVARPPKPVCVLYGDKSPKGQMPAKRH